MIRPTVGRIVWFHDNKVNDRHEPLAAIVTYVHSDTLVNLCVFDPNGVPTPKTSVRLEQEDDNASQENDAIPPEWANGNFYCRWMPYQKVQAEKTQALAEMHTHGQYGTSPGAQNR